MVPPLNPWKLPYKAGQSVACKILAAEPGGYSVVLPKNNLPGFLPTDSKLKPGEEILAEFVCVSDNRVLLSPRFASTPKLSRTNQMGPKMVEDKPSNLSEPDAAFKVWAKHVPRKYKLRRAIDILPSPVGDIKPTVFNMNEYNLEWLITNLEGGMRTCCVKAISENKKSRSAMLLYRGRAVGCIYGRKNLPESPPTEPALAFMLKDIAQPDTQVTLYDLPEEVVLSLSALFLGYPVQSADNKDARSYFDYLCNWFAEKEQTACIVLTLNTVHGHCLSLTYKGKYVGAFYVEDQQFIKDRDYIYQLLTNETNAGLDASILPPEIISSSVRFGFSLSMAAKNK